MVKRKFRRKTKVTRKVFRPLIPIKPNREVKAEPTDIVRREFALTESDRLFYSHEIGKDGKTKTVINVSQQVYIRRSWVTIVRYDSEHGYLHRHRRISMSNPSETVSTAGVIRKGKPGEWLSWAISDITKNYINNRVGFFRSSKIDNIY